MRRIREAFWQDAGCDLNRLAELVRRKAAGVSLTGPSIAGAEPLRRFVEQQQASTPALR